MTTRRVEAFSDGVFAVAITLLALDLPRPVFTNPHLAHFLSNHWPSFVAFLVSFLTIGIVWINHHAMFKRISVVDHTVMVLNLLLLMTVCVLPFTTALMAQYLRAASGENLAAAIWSGSYLVMSLVFFGMQRYVIVNKADSLSTHLTPEVRRMVMRRNTVGLLPYALAALAALITPYITLVICGLVAVFYALPGTTEVGIPPESPEP